MHPPRRCAWLLLAIGLAACTTVDTPRDPLDAGEWRTTKSRMYQDLALQCLRAEDHERACRLLQQAVQFDPRDRSSLELLARLAYGRGDLDTARGAALLLQELEPQSIAALCTLGAVAEAQDRHDEAEGLYRRALTLAPNDPRPGVDLHRLLLLRDREAEAAALRATLDARFPDGIATSLDHGAMLAADGRWADAALAYGRALAMRPEEPGAASGFALAAVLGRQPAAALAMADRLPPHARADHPALAMTLAIAQLQAGDGRAALRELDQLHATGRVQTALHVLRGEILASLGRPEAAQLEFERALALDPDEPRANAGLGRIQLAQGRGHAAVRLFERAVQAAPAQAANHALLAAALWLGGDVDRAARHAAIAGRDPAAASLLRELERLQAGAADATPRGDR